MANTVNHFRKAYKGPSGSHLSCLTKFSITGELNLNGTMHPTGRHNKLGIRRARTKDDKAIPICGARNSNRKGRLAKASKELDRRRRDCEVSIETIKRTQHVVYYEGMFKRPGSMKS